MASLHTHDYDEYMPEVPHQHENERILFRTRRSIGALLIGLFHSLWQGALVGLVLGALVMGVGFLLDQDPGAWMFFVSIGIAILLLVWRRVVIWRNITFTITSQRIISQHYHSLFRSATYAIQWDRYQGSTYEGGVLDRLTNTGVLIIHYGTADAAKELKIIRLPWAGDLKHYLDKIQSLRAANTVDLNLPMFVPAKKGKRDQAVLSYVD